MVAPWKGKPTMSTIEDYHSLAHSKWDCKYHLVFIPKGRKKRLYGKIRPRLGQIFHALAEQKDCKILEGHLMPDHVHMLVEVPPKFAVSSVIGFLKGKSAIAIAREFGGKERNYTGEHFWARGYALSTVGYDEEKIRRYIREQEQDEVSSAQGAF
jgi:REP-associated tyrosine transposase